LSIDFEVTALVPKVTALRAKAIARRAEVTGDLCERDRRPDESDRPRT
jgi:hypothetical protein